jgi:hypothetical protein
VFENWVKGPTYICQGKNPACKFSFDKLDDKIVQLSISSDMSRYIVPNFKFVGIDSDGDGIKDHLDDDDDNDGIVDTDDPFPLNPNNSANSNAESFKTSLFSVRYFNEGVEISNGTVNKPSINYGFSDFQNIPSQDFSAEWTGTIEILDDTKIIDFNVALSNSDAEVYVDGELISTWSNNSRTIELDLSTGVHTVKVNYTNNWHTVSFNTSFTPKTLPITIVDAPAKIGSFIDNTVGVVYIGAYEADTIFNESTITLSNTPQKVFLFVSSYSSINWIIDNPNNVEITGIAYSSYSSKSTITAETNIPIVEIDNLSYGYSNFSAPIAEIESIIGRVPDYTGGDYALSSINVVYP